MDGPLGGVGEEIWSHVLVYTRRSLMIKWKEIAIGALYYIMNSPNLN